MADRLIVLLTGSRFGVARDDVWGPLDAVARRAIERGVRTLTVRHGAAGDGADALARDWVDARMAPSAGLRGRLRCYHDPVPADWSGPCDDTCRHGPRGRRRNGDGFCQAAGMRRNAVMVAKEPTPDLCVAVLARCEQRKCAGRAPHDSHGTAGCVELAKAAGIPVWPRRVWRAPIQRCLIVPAGVVGDRPEGA